MRVQVLVVDNKFVHGFRHTLQGRVVQDVNSRSRTWNYSQLHSCFLPRHLLELLYPIPSLPLKACQYKC